MTILIYYKVYMTAMLQNENVTLTIRKKLPFLSVFTDILVKFRVNYANRRQNKWQLNVFMKLSTQNITIYALT